MYYYLDKACYKKNYKINKLECINYKHFFRCNFSNNLCNLHKSILNIKIYCKIKNICSIYFCLITKWWTIHFTLLVLIIPNIIFRTLQTIIGTITWYTIIKTANNTFWCCLIKIISLITKWTLYALWSLIISNSKGNFNKNINSYNDPLH